MLSYYLRSCLCCLVCISLFGPANAAPLITDSVRIDGINRTFHYSLPGNTKGASLVFVLHMSGSHGKEVSVFCDSLMGMQDAGKVILVFPDGYKRFWNECRKMSTAEANRLDIDEQSFFRSMIQFFRTRYKASADKVFVIGSSGGGHMAYKLAMTMPGEIRGIAAILASLPDSSNMDCDPANKPLPVMIVNSDADLVNPFYGGEINASGVVLGKVMSTHNTFQYWLNLAGHRPKPLTEELPDEDPYDGSTIYRVAYHGEDKPSVELWTIRGGGHWYPGDIDVHVEAWNFFKREMDGKGFTRR